MPQIILQIHFNFPSSYPRKLFRPVEAALRLRANSQAARRLASQGASLPSLSGRIGGPPPIIRRTRNRRPCHQGAALRPLAGPGGASGALWGHPVPLQGAAARRRGP